MKVRIWFETGGDTGGGEVYCSAEAEVAHIDWDDFNEALADPRAAEDSLGVDPVELATGWLHRFGDVMPDGTRRELVEFLTRVMAQQRRTAEEATAVAERATSVAETLAQRLRRCDS